MTVTFTYRREGNGHVQGPYGNLTSREVFTLIGRSLEDNLRTPRAEAKAFADSVQPGEPATFGPYTFEVHRQVALRTKLAKAVVEAGERIYAGDTWAKSYLAFQAEGRNLDVYADVRSDGYSGSLVDQGLDPATLEQKADFIAMEIGECF